jgi:prepilin-type N-terminal cleavage/methylation domain-containing protein
MSRWMPPDAIDVRRWTRPIARRVCCETGFTLIELLVAMAAGLLVGAAALTFMVVTFHEQNDISSRTVASNRAEQGLEQLVADVREAMTSVTISAPTAGTTQIQFNIPTPANDTVGESVTWTCPSTGATSVGSCTRALTTTTGTQTKTEITGVQSMAFTPTYGGTATTPTSATDIASVAMTLIARITNYGLTSNGTVTTAVKGTANAPIVLEATADLRNFA